jgi:hypothetical protein
VHRPGDGAVWQGRRSEREGRWLALCTGLVVAATVCPMKWEEEGRVIACQHVQENKRKEIVCAYVNTFKRTKGKR